MKSSLMLERQRAAWKRIARAAAALARSKGHDVQDPEYTSGGGADHELMLNLETVATALEKVAGIWVEEKPVAEAVEEEAAAHVDEKEAGADAAEEEKPTAPKRRARRTRKK